MPTNEILPALKSLIKSFARESVPRPTFELAQRVRGLLMETPPVGGVRFGDFRRLEPLSRCYGYDRGRPIDRYYIENFLAAQGHRITGNVLEIGENTYTKAFGRGVTKSDVLHVMEGIAGTTYVDDLTDGSTLPSNTFDCVILTQTLHLIYDMRAALATIYRILKPGGALLLTVPGITQISDTDWNDSWYWSLTTNSANRLCKDVFPPPLVECEAYGNVLAATSFLQGLADTELSQQELDHFDREYPVIISVKCIKAHRELAVPMTEAWNYGGKAQFAYDDETSYRKGMAFLDGKGEIEDWGCGTAFAKQFAQQSRYIGIDGSTSVYCDKVVDLQEYVSQVDCIFMRHVLEHNWGWRKILRNAVSSFKHRLVLVVFTPFQASEMKLREEDGHIDLALNKEEVLSYFEGLKVTEERIESKTQYGEETLFYVEKVG